MMTAKDQVLQIYPHARCGVDPTGMFGITVGRGPYFETVGDTEEEAWQNLADKENNRFSDAIADLAKLLQRQNSAL
jgi:hypothetical protein